VLTFLRDYVIHKNELIRDIFHIKSIKTDFMVKRQQLKETIKEIAGDQVTYEEIE